VNVWNMGGSADPSYNALSGLPEYWKMYVAPLNFSPNNSSVGGLVSSVRPMGVARSIDQNQSSPPLWYRLQRTWPAYDPSPGYEHEIMMGRIHGRVLIAAKYVPAMGWWSYRVRWDDRPADTACGAYEPYMTVLEGTATVLPIVMPRYEIPMGVQAVKYPTPTGPTALQDADLRTIPYSHGATQVIADTTDPATVDVVWTSIWSDSFGDDRSLEGTPSIVDTGTVGPSIPGGLWSWFDQQRAVVEGWAASFGSWLWPLEVIGEM